jgi:hypothetical protein
MVWRPGPFASLGGKAASVYTPRLMPPPDPGLMVKVRSYRPRLAFFRDGRPVGLTDHASERARRSHVLARHKPFNHAGLSPGPGHRLTG